MKQDLTKYMREKQLDAILVTGMRMHNPLLAYFVGDNFFTNADVLVRPDEEPVLFYRPMERDCAASSGMNRVCYDQLSIEGYFPPREQCRDSSARNFAAILKYAGIERGRISICGRVEFSSMYESVSALRKALPGIEIDGSGGTDCMDQARFSKGPEEIAHIKHVSNVLTEVVGKVEAFIRSGKLRGDKVYTADGEAMTIGMIRAKINLWLAERGLENPEGTIFSLGRDAGVPHNGGEDSDVLTAGKSIVYDFFPCEAGGGYFSDFTRTWSIGYAPDYLRESYDLVKRVHDTLVDSIVPGMPFKELQRKTCEMFREAGHQTIAEDPHLTCGYVHSVGHGLGLNIHERPFSGFSADPRDVLIPGTVFTIEPGLYYPDDGDRAYGVRIEDTYYMDEDGKVCRLTDYPYELVIPVEKEN